MKKKHSVLSNIFFWTGLILISAYVLIPIFNVVLASVKPLEEIQVTGKSIFPSRFDFGTYQRVWTTVPLLQYIKNSLIVISCSTALSVIISIFAGFAMNRFRFRGKELFGNMLIVSQLTPQILMLLPIYLIYVTIKKYLGIQMVGTYQGLIILYLTFSIPFSIWMMKSYFTSIPVELEEAAFIDGCGYLQTIFRIIIPVSIPGVISVAIYSFLIGWEEVLFASVLTNNSTRTVAIGLRNYAAASTVYWNEMMAAAVTVTIPIIVVFIVIQKYLISGFTAGSVKG